MFSVFILVGASGSRVPCLFDEIWAAAFCLSPRKALWAISHLEGAWSGRRATAEVVHVPGLLRFPCKLARSLPFVWGLGATLNIKGMCLVVSANGSRDLRCRRQRRPRRFVVHSNIWRMCVYVVQKCSIEWKFAHIVLGALRARGERTSLMLFVFCFMEAGMYRPWLVTVGECFLDIRQRELFETFLEKLQSPEMAPSDLMLCH